MNRTSRVPLAGLYARGGTSEAREAAGAARSLDAGIVARFDLLRWFSILSFVAITLCAVAMASILSHFLTREVLQRDAILTSQFISSIAKAQESQAGVEGRVTLGQLLDARDDPARLGVDPAAAKIARAQFLDHIRVLPDVLLGTVFARDRKIIWSTNPELVGKVNEHNHELEEVFSREESVVTEYGTAHNKEEQRFLGEPEQFFVENYVPLFDPKGEVVAVVEVYKEPRSLVETIRRGHLLVWGCMALGGLALYFAFFWIVRRADRTLHDQQRRLLDSETLVVIGEMSAAVAHGIRNPLATIRSSAELALDGDVESTRKNANDIIVQVDRLGKWVRDLLTFSRPVNGETEVVELGPLVDDCLLNFSAQFERNRITCELDRPAAPLPAVAGNRALMTQALGSVISNAIEAMPNGGVLRLGFEVAPLLRRIDLVVTDTGTGMTPAQCEQVFKPFYTTKRNGLGLGMALVKRILERFGGTIRLRSKEGEGTQVQLSFHIA